jgi:hypothetical protein
MKYIKVGWPEVQDFMIVESEDTIYFDPQKNVWFVSEELYNKAYENSSRLFKKCSKGN